MAKGAERIPNLEATYGEAYQFVEPSMNLATFLEITVGAASKRSAVYAIEASALIDALSLDERESLLESLNSDQQAQLSAQRMEYSFLARSCISAALRELCARQTKWTTEIAMHTLGACRQSGDYRALGGAATLTAMLRDGVCFPLGDARDREFTGLTEAFGDVGEDGKARRAAHDLFGRLYIPRTVSSHDATNDGPFQKYLTWLTKGLHNVAMLRERVRTEHPDWYSPCSGQAVSPEIFLTLRPQLHKLDVFALPAGNTLGQIGVVRELASWKWWFAFANPELMPIDEPWVFRNASAYRHWEDRFGEARWIERLVPSTPKTLRPRLVDHLVTARGAKPSGRWLKQASAIIAEHNADYRDGILEMLSRLGSADVIRESEVAWKEAGVYAFLHLDYRKKYSQGWEQPQTLPELLYLPWVKEGKTYLHNGLPTNPMTLSEQNTDFARGLVWASSFWNDDEVVSAVALAAGGAMQPLDLGGYGLRMRSLALLNACIWSLSNNVSIKARHALESLLNEATDSRARKAIEAALSTTQKG